MYENYLKSERDAVISQLRSDITSFSRADMETLQQFDRYLDQSVWSARHERLGIFHLFRKQQLLDTVRLKKRLALRENDMAYLGTASVKTDSFDSTIFQRKF